MNASWPVFYGSVSKCAFFSPPPHFQTIWYWDESRFHTSSVGPLSTDKGRRMLMCFCCCVGRQRANSAPWANHKVIYVEHIQQFWGLFNLSEYITQCMVLYAEALSVIQWCWIINEYFLLAFCHQTPPCLLGFLVLLCVLERDASRSTSASLNKQGAKCGNEVVIWISLIIFYHKSYW